MNKQGLTEAYIFITWGDIEKVPGQFDFSGLDQMVISAHAHGVHLMVQVQAEGMWTAPGPAQLLGNGGTRINSQEPGFPNPVSSAPKNLAAPLPFWRALV